MSSPVVRLLLPAALGLAGLTGNYVWVNWQVAPGRYVALTQDVPTGRRISDGALEAVELPGHGRIRARDFIPWSDKALAENAAATRPLKAGSLLLVDDVKGFQEQPDGFDLLYVPLGGVAFRPDRIRPGATIAFLVRVPDVEEKAEAAGEEGVEPVAADATRIGPFRVFEPPVLDVDDLDLAERGRAKVAMPMAVLVPHDDPDRLGVRLHRAVAGDDVIALEIVGGR